MFESFDRNFESRELITVFAAKVVEGLQGNVVDLRRDSEWTKSNFLALSALFPEGVANFFHRENKNEFLWDFIAQRKERGFLYLVAESEAQTKNHEKLRLLTHDFEKLLYVYAPVKVMICKAEDEAHAELIKQTLEDYGNDCCVNFNPGSVFILHCSLWNRRGSVTFSWQSSGEPRSLALESLQFGAGILRLHTEPQS